MNNPDAMPSQYERNMERDIDRLDAEVERLRAENERLTERVNQIVDWGPADAGTIVFDQLEARDAKIAELTEERDVAKQSLATMCEGYDSLYADAAATDAKIADLERLVTMLLWASTT